MINKQILSLLFFVFSNKQFCSMFNPEYCWIGGRPSFSIGRAADKIYITQSKARKTYRLLANIETDPSCTQVPEVSVRLTIEEFINKARMMLDLAKRATESQEPARAKICTALAHKFCNQALELCKKTLEEILTYGPVSSIMAEIDVVLNQDRGT